MASGRGSARPEVTQQPEVPAGARKADADELVTELVKRHNDGEYRSPERVT